MRVAVFACAVFCLTGVPYRIVGLLNRRGRLASVFFCYAGSRAFVRSYGLPGIAEMFRWRPSPIGIMRQGDEWGIVMASSMTEADFLDPANADDFAKLQMRLTRAAGQMGARDNTVAGILPGVLKATDGMAFCDTKMTVVAAVTAAVGRMRDAHFPDGLQDVIVLGGAGRIGSVIVKDLRAQGLTCHVVDPAHGLTDFPHGLKGQRVLLLDVARKGAIADYIPLMWPGLVVLNEVFPAPSRRLVADMQAKGVEVFHLVGVYGRVMPPLPHGYQSAVPCCAARPTKGAPDVRIIALG
ncbi:MAG: hypothetical protein AAFU41_04815 [Pseudomonadota bacterium]